MRVTIRALTDHGIQREHNEDRHAVWISDDPCERVERGVLALVADGMGGMNAGEVASAMVAEGIVQAYRSASDPDPAAALANAFAEANRSVFRRSELDDEHRGMGTTCAAIVVRGQRAWVANVGDSRAYLLRSNEMVRLTRDHSVVAELVRRGEISEEDARRDTRKNALTRSMGAAPTVIVDVSSPDEDLEPGDTIILCTDGLHGLVTDDEIAVAFLESGHAAPGLLIDMVNARGGPDNITIVALHLDEPGEEPQVDADSPGLLTTSKVGCDEEGGLGGGLPGATGAPTKNRDWPRWWVFVIGLLALALLVWLVFRHVRGRAAQRPETQRVVVYSAPPGKGAVSAFASSPERSEVP